MMSLRTYVTIFSVHNISIRALSLLLLIGCGSLSYGQVTIQVVDQLSQEPIANVQVNNLNDSAETTTNSRGFAHFSAEVGDSVVLSADQYAAGVIVIPEQSAFQASLDIVEEALAFKGSIKNFYRQLGKVIVAGYSRVSIH